MSFLPREMISPAAHGRTPAAYRRRLHYVDSSMQRSLMVAMVVLEVFLVAASIWFAHWQLIELIDQSMYRMNLAHSGPTLLRLAEKGFVVLGLFALVNVAALMVAAKIWSRHENLVLQDFAKLVAKTRELDFSADPESRRQHQVLALAARWRARERARFLAVREQLASLDGSGPSREFLEEMRVAVTRLDKLLS